ncbi:hypothetical protein PLICRDRAFT_34671 [Plicaturopsis crispa FD-325 SS-3]|nr:hypothetical protein PLICRDRAFT_34671 [Plicaturopsis crispa FD-325 SS-3]
MGFIAALSLACIAVACVLLPPTTHSGSLWVLIAIPGASIAGALWSTTRKAVNRAHPQRVAIELTWLFAVIPFEIILGMFTATVAPPPPATAHFQALYTALRALVWIHATLVCTYVLSLLLLALATQACYDRDVFMKDIDASPSPFPLRVVFAYLRACVFRRGATARRLAVADVCLPGCACDRKLHRLDAGDGDSEVDVEPGEGFIRVPTEDERRNSIVVTFEAVY